MKTRIKQIKHPSGRIEYVCQFKMFNTWMIFIYPEMLLSGHIGFRDMKWPSGRLVTFETMSEAQDHIIKFIDQNTISKKKPKPVVTFFEFPLKK